MNRLLDSLNDRQRRAVTQTEGPLLVVAGAGSGKTRVLTHRVAHIVGERKAAPAEVLAVTFTNKAAGEMRDRIGALLGFDVSRLWISTFHSFCARFLRMESAQLGYPSNFTILDEDDSRTLVNRCLKELGISGSQFSPPTVMRAISRAKNRLYDADRFAAEAAGYYDEKIARIFSLYEHKLRAAAACDFDDLLGLAVKVLAEKGEVRRHWQERFGYLMVDEYQDTNHAQYVLLRHLVGPKKNICVVGDEDQSIYGWRGADISNILNFEADFPGAEIIKLEQNYRSTQTILSAASSVIKNNTTRKEKTLWSDLKGGEKVIVALHETQADEAEYVIARALEKKEAYSLQGMVVLYRTNAQSRAFEETLRREKIPYQIVGGISFYQRKEIKDLLAYMKLAANPRDEAAFVRIVNVPKRALGETSLEKLTVYTRQNNLSLLDGASRAEQIGTMNARSAGAFKNFADMIHQLRQKAVTYSLDQFIQAVIDATGLDKAILEEDPLTGEGRLENIEEFIAAAAEYVQTHPDPTLDNFLAEITLYSDADTYKEGDDKLTLMTLHNAKGLEFDLVFITGLEDGLFPLARSFDDPMELEEERRLFYVGATRAKKELALTAARQRRRYGAIESAPSRFLSEIPSDLTLRIDRRSYRWEFGPAVRPAAVPSSGDSRPEGVYYEYDEESGLRAGTIVLHPKFGQGRILTVEGSGDNLRVNVDFAAYGPKKLIAKFARLTVISRQ